MATYDYRCSACKHEFETEQSMHDKSLKKCPKCKKLKLQRVIGTGGGFRIPYGYKTVVKA